MNRTRWLAVAALALLAAGLLAGRRWSRPEGALACPPSQVRFKLERGARVARCADGEPPTAAEAMALGLKLDLNRATAEELALLPGVGHALGERLVEARGRLGRFQQWDQVDEVAGIGAAKLELLKARTELR